MIKKILFQLKDNPINLFFLFIGFFFIFISLWLLRLFGEKTYYIEILYNFIMAYEGTKHSPFAYKLDFFLSVINTSVFFSVLFFFVVKYFRELIVFKSSFINKILKLLINCKVFAIYGIVFFLIQFRFYDYLIEYSKFKDPKGLYLDPRKITFSNPDNKKNIILIYVESLEADVNTFSKISPIQAINNIKGKTVKDFKHAPSTHWSIAAMMSSLCSVPLQTSIGIDFFKKNRKKFYCIGDVLSKHGYHQNYFMTVHKNFHGTGYFYSRQGYRVYDSVAIMQENQEISNTGWAEGIQDDDLLEFAKSKIIEKHKNKHLFNMTIKTTDTHFPFEYSEKCNQSLEQGFDEEKKDMIIAYQCTSELLFNFINDLEDKGIMDNTLLIIMGDTLGHTIKGDKTRRNIYFKIQSQDQLTRNKMNHFDVAPTILDALGFMPKNKPKFGFGYSLLSSKKINYDDHYENVMNKSILSDRYMQNLFRHSKPKFNSTPDIWKTPDTK